MHRVAQGLLDGLLPKIVLGDEGLGGFGGFVALPISGKEFERCRVDADSNHQQVVELRLLPLDGDLRSVVIE